MTAISNSTSIRRPALGGSHTLGDFYNLPSDTFLNAKLLRRNPTEITTINKVHHLQYNYNLRDTLLEKFKILNIDRQFQLSVLSGIPTSCHPGDYLKNCDEDTTTLVYTLTAIEEQLHFNDAESISKYVSHDALRLETCATHYVSEVVSGGIIFVTIDNDMEKEDPPVDFQTLIQDLETTGCLNYDLCLNKRIQIRGSYIHYENYPPKNNLKATLETAVSVQNEGKGIPLSYKLSNLNDLKTHFSLVSSPINYVEIRETIVTLFIDLFAQINSINLKVNELNYLLRCNRGCFSNQDVDSLRDQEISFNSSVTDLKWNLRSSLHSVRCSQEEGSQFLDLIGGFTNPLQTMNNFLQVHYELVTGRVRFVRLLRSLDVKFLRNYENLENILFSENFDDLVFMCGSEYFRVHVPDEWIEGFSFVTELIKISKRNSDRRMLFYYVDTDLHPNIIQGERRLRVEMWDRFGNRFCNLLPLDFSRPYWQFRCN